MPRLQAWADVIQRGKEIQMWVEQALPKALQGQRVMVDELKVPHVNAEDEFETSIHILASPPWSMKVMKGFKDVTPENVKNVLVLSQLCGPSGIPTVR